LRFLEPAFLPSPIMSSSSAVERTARPGSRTARLLGRGGLLTTAVSFGAVGLGGVVIDVGVFTVLRLGALSDKPLTAGVLSASAAIVFNWVGNRYWTFGDRRRTDVLRELLEYGAVALLGLGISLLCLAVSHYVLGLHSLAADTIAKNVIGLALGTVVRFTLSRWWVWNPARSTGTAVSQEAGR
jgi:putative flippase GtrA